MLVDRVNAMLGSSCDDGVRDSLDKPVDIAGHVGIGLREGKDGPQDMPTANAPDTASVQRNAVVRANSGRSTENKSLTAYIMDHRLLVGSVHLATEPPHVHINKIALGHELVVPDLFEQHRAS